MIPFPAQYLLRFDDLCPTVSLQRWQRFLPMIEEFCPQPILAVVPDNQDPGLKLSPPDPQFWNRMRDLESAGATIGLHGYRHISSSHGRSLLPLHPTSEFAGVPENLQRQWIREGLRILRGHGLNPKIWVAPRHGLDRNTLRALQAEGIDLLSDGFARVPFARDGVTWIPQQLWEPVEKPNGLWTICVHPNTATDLQVARLHEFLSRHAEQITSVDRVLAEFPTAKLNLTERLYGTGTLWRIQASRLKKAIQHRFRKSDSD